MKAFLKSLSSVDRHAEYLIFGFIRKNETRMHGMIPTLISWTCLAFYWLNEYFGIIRDSHVTVKDQTINHVLLH